MLFVLLLFLYLKKHNIKCETVIYYYENRVKIIDKYYKGNKDLCKIFINSSFFKDAEWIKPLNDFERKIKKRKKKLFKKSFIIMMSMKNLNLNLLKVVIKKI